MRLVWIAWVAACTQDVEIVEQKRALATEQATFDAGVVAIGDRQPLTVWLESIGQGAVTVFDVQVDDPDHWAVSTAWTTWDESQDPPGDADGYLTIPGGSEEDPSYAPLEVTFMPDAEGEYRTLLTVASNDNEVDETDDEGRGIWRVVLRGIGLYPCAEVYPVHLDFGRRPAGGYFSEIVTIENCGAVTLTVADFDIEGATKAFSVATPTPIYVLPGSTETFEVGVQASGGTPPERATLTLDVNDPDFDTEIALVVNDCTESIHDTWDDDGDGWLYDDGSGQCGRDCDDHDPEVHPGAAERTTNGKDDDCDGLVDETGDSRSTDDDGDGLSENDGDCDDADASVHPGAEETLNHVDDDCDGKVDEGTEWTDDDGDGLSEREGDCDDGDVLVHPGAEETNDGIDEDCDGIVDEGTYAYDDDADGYAELDDPADCNDADPWSHPDAAEDCDDRDNDCDGTIDEGDTGEPGGACAFLVERTPSDSGDDRGGHCGAVPAGHATALLALLAAAGLGARRRA